MNKKVFGTMAVVAAMFAGYSVYNAQDETENNSIAITNIEALARSEDEVTCKKDKGDECLVGTTPVSDYDEDDSWF